MEKRKNQRLRAADYFDQKRTYLRQFFTVFDRINDQPVGHVVDISAGGMMMINKEPIKAGKILRLRVELPEVVKTSGRLMVEARCVWCKKEENPDCHYTGFEFMSISPEQVAIIEKLISQYAPVELAQPNPAGD